MAGACGEGQRRDGEEDARPPEGRGVGGVDVRERVFAFRACLLPKGFFFFFETVALLFLGLV